MPKRGTKREEWEVRQDFTNNEAILGRCAFDFDEEGHGVELEFEAFRRVKLGEEHCWTAPTEGSDDFQWRQKK